MEELPPVPNDYLIMKDQMEQEVLKNKSAQTILEIIEKNHTFNNDMERLTMGVLILNAMYYISQRTDTTKQTMSELDKQRYMVDNLPIWTPEQSSQYMEIVIRTYLPMLHRVRPMSLPVALTETQQIIVAKTYRLPIRFHWHETRMQWTDETLEEYYTNISTEIRESMESKFGQEEILYVYIPIITTFESDFVMFRFARAGDVPNPNSPKLGPQ